MRRALPRRELEVLHESSEPLPDILHVYERPPHVRLSRVSLRVDVPRAGGHDLRGGIHERVGLRPGRGLAGAPRHPRGRRRAAASDELPASASEVVPSSAHRRPAVRARGPPRSPRRLPGPAQRGSLRPGRGEQRERGRVDLRANRGDARAGRLRGRLPGRLLRARRRLRGGLRRRRLRRRRLRRRRLGRRARAASFPRGARGFRRGRAHHPGVACGGGTRATDGRMDGCVREASSRDRSIDQVFSRRNGAMREGGHLRRRILPSGTRIPARTPCSCVYSHCAEIAAASGLRRPPSRLVLPRI